MSINKNYIKFLPVKKNLSFRIEEKDFEELSKIRTALFQLGLIGKDIKTGVSYGNISKRTKMKEFIITCSNTGEKKALGKNGYAYVMDINAKTGEVFYHGACNPSSESFSHEAIYRQLDWVKSVIHIHNHALWERCYHEAAGTSSEATYGSVELANEITKLLQLQSFKKDHFFITKGHEAGIFTFGKSCHDAFEELIKQIKRKRLLH